MYLDIHTHRRPDPENRTGDISVYNLSLGELLSGDWKKDPSGRVAPYHYVSAGLHPWDLPSGSPQNRQGDNLMDLQKQLELIKYVSEYPQVRLLGECGLDKLKGGDPTTQQQAFLFQAKVATEQGKPMIIHCVKAYDELLALQKTHQYGVPMIIHGFNKSPKMSDQLTKHGFLLSFGAAILRENSHAAASMIHQYQHGSPIFLETDNSGYPIALIYARAANLLEISVEALKDVIFASWKKIGLIHE